MRENITISKLKEYKTKINKKIKLTNNNIIRYNNFIITKLEKKYHSYYSKDNINELLISKYNDVFLKRIERYVTKMNKYANFARKTTVPINYPYYLYLRKRNKKNYNILFEDGVHFFVALQGGGKSTLAYELIERIRKNTNKSAYVNADFEIPKLDEISKKYYKYHQRFELLEFFDMSVKDYDPDIKVTQLKKFNRNFDTIVLDEWLTEMNHRLNKTKHYNNIFLALLTMIAHMRHQKMKRIYVLSQIDNTDTQLLSMFKYIHELEIDLNIEYGDWVKSGRLSKNIKGWTVWTYGVKRNRKLQSNDKVLLKKQYIEKTADFEYFDTLSQASKYETLNEDKIKFI